MVECQFLWTQMIWSAIVFSEWWRGVLKAQLKFIWIKSIEGIRCLLQKLKVIANQNINSLQYSFERRADVSNWFREAYR